MFSYTPYSDSQFFPWSHGSTRPRSYPPIAYRYGKVVPFAEEQAAREAAARRAAAERETNPSFGQYEDDNDNEGDGYGFSRSYTPRQRDILEAQRLQNAAEKQRARLIVEERKRGDEEIRARREQETSESLKQFYGNPGLRTSDAHKADEPVSSPGLPDHDLTLTHDTP